MSEKRTARSETRDSPDSRRSFLWKIWLGLGGLAVIEYATLAADFLRPRKPGGGEQEDPIIVAGPLKRFKPGTITAFQKGKFYLARLEDGGFLALSRKCTHLGCTVPWRADENRFVCPCHGSIFDIRGDVVRPPAPRPLDLYLVRIENGIVKIDASTPMQRQSFDLSQVTQA